ncbi:FAD binding domain protein [Bisporella sp. PMI_857]|nr:FAD binding domain protein [Bisporella sp. PMI_857]
MNQIQKVIIVGAGPAGLLAALQLSRDNNLSPVVYEVRSEPTTLGGAIGIPSNGLRLLHRLGLYDALRARGAETSDLVLHARKGDILGRVDMTSWSKPKTGFGYLRIRRTELMDELYKAIEKAAIPIHYNKDIVRIEEHDQGVTACFSDGTTDTAQLLLGCDGLHSAVRTIYVDPEFAPEYSGISNIFSIVSTSGLPTSAESLEGLNATLTTDGLFAMTPCTTPCSMIYWFFSREIAIPASGDSRDGWEERGKKEVETLKDTLLNLIGDAEGNWGSILREVVRQTEVLKFYPVYRMPLGGRWSRGRCLIIGDAAHAMQPHASQGVSMALEDIALLSKVLKSGGHSLQDTFRKYEETRRPRVEEMHKSAERNGSVRKKIGPWRLWLNEQGVAKGLWLYDLLNLGKLGLGQKPLAYDINEEETW